MSDLGAGSLGGSVRGNTRIVCELVLVSRTTRSKRDLLGWLEGGIASSLWLCLWKEKKRA